VGPVGAEVWQAISNLTEQTAEDLLCCSVLNSGHIFSAHFMDRKQKPSTPETNILMQNTLEKE
jgi:hypothetical protein